MDAQHCILLKIDDAAAALAVSRRTLYTLIATNADIRSAVVRIPGVSRTFLHAERLREAVERMAPAEKAA